MRIGHGYDVHKLVEGRPLVLGGVTVPFEMGLLGHSDADVLLHAICDALLGAAALGDIGKHFPDNDNAYLNIDSRILLKKTVGLLSEKGYRAFLYGEGYGITAITNGKAELEGEKGKYISVFSASDISVGVTLKNLKYTLTDGELRNNFPLGVSNEFTGETAELSVKKGTLVIYYTL